MAYGKPNLADGVQPFLDATKHENNGMDYGRFRQVMDAGLHAVVIVSELAKRSGKQRSTVKRWIEQYHKEQQQ